MKVGSGHGAGMVDDAQGEREFPTPICEALFAAVLVHDDIYPDAELPANIQLNYSQQQLGACYRICRQIWKQGVQRRDLSRIIGMIRRHHALAADDQLQFKYLRARFKHLRFAYAAFDNRHRYPRAFHWLTAIMGYLQDALKNGQAGAVNRSALLLRLLLMRLPFYLIGKEIDNFSPSTPETFAEYVNQQVDVIRSNLDMPRITSKAFHETRKVISRLVAIYDNLKILYPSSEHQNISQYLSTVNGLMGALHDELVAMKFSKTQDYDADAFAWPGDIQRRLVAIAASYGQAR